MPAARARSRPRAAARLLDDERELACDPARRDGVDQGLEVCSLARD